MSAQTTSPPAWWSSLVGLSLPPVPDGWERTEPGSPLLRATYKEGRIRLSLQWCPACGPEVETFDVGGPGRTMEQHILEYHAGFPEDFGLDADRLERDTRLDEFGGDGDG